ncbi:adenosylcobinamide-GDP ribazoletransferase, partial [Streptomyces zhihengii]|uniref:adenosylcobinamide-GDP ribazoletransferase n=1 Tax=Streptomyces zhihengii TaxID=1818004 RepID=UPI003F50E448
GPSPTSAARPDSGRSRTAAPAPSRPSPRRASDAVLALAAALAVAELLLRRCVRRFGGVTGDVFGALAETAATVALLVSALG